MADGLEDDFDDCLGVTIEDDSPHSKKRKIVEHPANIDDKIVKKKRKKKNKTQHLEEKPNENPREEFTTFVQKHTEGTETELTDKRFTLCNDSQQTETQYLSAILPRWEKKIAKAENKKGDPLLLILTCSALRASQLNREINAFKGKHCKTVKLFAKHMKLDEQIKFLKSSCVHLGVGTPNRILALRGKKAILFDQLTHVVIDWNWRDLKLRRIADIPEIKNDLVSLLVKEIIPLVMNGQVKVGLM